MQMAWSQMGTCTGPLSPLPSPDRGSDSDHDLVLSRSMTISSISSHSNWSVWTNGGGSAGRRPHVKINLHVFKDEQLKDAVTYHTWWWDVAIHRISGCGDWALLPRMNWSLQGFCGELAQRLGKDATLKEVLWMLDEHYGVVMTFGAQKEL